MTIARLAFVAVLLALCGCERSFRDMYDQPRYKPLAASRMWPDGRSSRSHVEGTVPHGEGTFAGTSSGRLGEAPAAPAVLPLDTVRDRLRPGDSSSPTALAMPQISRALLERGRERFDVYCAPCHGTVGDGDGMVVRRGFPRPPSYHSDELRAASDAHLYAVITYGYGAMYSYATRVAPADRLAIIAYIRALQMSQHAPLDALSPDERAQLPAQGEARR
jgi:mono/diheme cytochrome c family protein